MPDVPEQILFEGVSVDVLFDRDQPCLGDLVVLCGHRPNAQFPVNANLRFGDLAFLQFEAIDDYFGVRSLASDGADVVVWLYPIISGAPVYHDPGPYDAFRVSYNVLRNSVRHVDHYLRCVSALASKASGVHYRNRDVRLALPPDLADVHADINAAIQTWATKGVTVGSEAALRINY